MSLGWSGGAKVLCILHHWGVQLILAYSWARPAILVVGKGRGGMFLFLLFLHFHSCSSFFPVPLSSPLLSLLSLFSHSLGDDTKWPSRVDVSLNPNTINQIQHVICWQFLPRVQTFKGPGLTSKLSAKGTVLILSVLLAAKHVLQFNSILLIWSLTKSLLLACEKMRVVPIGGLIEWYCVCAKFTFLQNTSL